MWIKFQRSETATFHDSECMPDGYVVELNYEGIAQVKQSVGAALIDKYDTISEYEK